MKIQKIKLRFRTDQIPLDLSRTIWKCGYLNVLIFIWSSALIPIGRRMSLPKREQKKRQKKLKFMGSRIQCPSTWRLFPLLIIQHISSDGGRKEGGGRDTERGLPGQAEPKSACDKGNHRHRESFHRWRKHLERGCQDFLKHLYSAEYSLGRRLMRSNGSLIRCTWGLLGLCSPIWLLFMEF